MQYKGSNLGPSESNVWAVSLNSPLSSSLFMMIMLEGMIIHLLPKKNPCRRMKHITFQDCGNILDGSVKLPEELWNNYFIHGVQHQASAILQLYLHIWRCMFIQHFLHGGQMCVHGDTICKSPSSAGSCFSKSSKIQWWSLSPRERENQIYCFSWTCPCCTTFQRQQTLFSFPPDVARQESFFSCQWRPLNPPFMIAFLLILEWLMDKNPNFLSSRDCTEP